jgi:putative ABC transport system substrate-binding protein
MVTRRLAGPTVVSGRAAEGLVVRAAPAIGLVALLALLGLAILAMPMVVAAQPAKKIPRLCFLIFDPGTFETRPPRWEAFFQRLSELGYVNGRTVTIDYMSAEGRHERFTELAEECLRRKADVIAVTRTPGGFAAKKATPRVPIVMLSLGDPVGTGLISSITRPEGNITGATMMTSDLAGKRLELLKETMPRRWGWRC